MASESECSWITSSSGDPFPPPGQNWAFPETRWSLVINAAKDDVVAADALEELCRTYWYPIYSHARRLRNSPHDAMDLTQGFFEDLLRGNYLAKADRSKGKLRYFLLTSLKNFSAYQHRKQTAKKRGGGAPVISLDEELAEQRFQNEPRVHENEHPDRVFERKWATTLLETVLQSLGREYTEAGKDELFVTLAGFLAWNSGDTTYAAAAKRLGMKEGAIKVAVHRMRKRFREILYEEILNTVSSPEEVEEEIDYLLRVLSR